MKGKSQHPHNEAASLKYVLKILYAELRAHTGDCQHCDDVLFLYRKLQSLCREQKIKIEAVEID